MGWVWDTETPDLRRDQGMSLVRRESYIPNEIIDAEDMLAQVQLTRHGIGAGDSPCRSGQPPLLLNELLLTFLPRFRALLRVDGLYSHLEDTTHRAMV